MASGILLSWALEPEYRILVFLWSLGLLEVPTIRSTFLMRLQYHCLANVQASTLEGPCFGRQSPKGPSTQL